jgi:hypothetical protein
MEEAKELSSIKTRIEDYSQINKTDLDLAKRIRGEVHRFQRKLPDLQQIDPNTFERILLAYLNTHRDTEYSSAMVAQCAPFIFCLESECDAYYCFERLMQVLGKEPPKEGDTWLTDSFSA